MGKQSSYIQPRSFLCTWHGKAINQHRNSSIIIVIVNVDNVVVIVYVVVIADIIVIIITINIIFSWRLWCISVHLILRTQCIVVEHISYKIVIIVIIIFIIIIVIIEISLDNKVLSRITFTAPLFLKWQDYSSGICLLLNLSHLLDHFYANLPPSQICGSRRSRLAQCTVTGSQRQRWSEGGALRLTLPLQLWLRSQFDIYTWPKLDLVK